MKRDEFYKKLPKSERAKIKSLCKGFDIQQEQLVNLLYDAQFSEDNVLVETLNKYHKDVSQVGYIFLILSEIANFYLEDLKAIDRKDTKLNNFVISNHFFVIKRETNKNIPEMFKNMVFLSKLVTFSLDTESLINTIKLVKYQMEDLKLYNMDKGADDFVSFMSVLLDLFHSINDAIKKEDGK